MNGQIEVFLELLATADGGRTAPIFLGGDVPAHYSPDLRVTGGDGEYLGVQFIDGPEGPLEPGESCYATARFVYEPQVSYKSLVVGAEFEIMEGARVVGRGRVVRSYD